MTTPRRLRFVAQLKPTRTEERSTSRPKVEKIWLGHMGSGSAPAQQLRGSAGHRTDSWKSGAVCRGQSPGKDHP
eukprot:16329014-Heterocapsa_arctica.AAC.1